jgi:hypothetical protein
MLSVAKLHFTHDGKPNRHAFHDVGLAVGNLILQATALGLSVYQMAGFDVEKARRPSRSRAVMSRSVGSLWDVPRA